MGKGRQHYEQHCKAKHIQSDWDHLPQQVKEEWDKRAAEADAAGDPPPEVPPIIPT